METRDSPKSHTFKFRLLDVIDFMLNPAVGVVMLGASSLASCFRIVVLPELSNPSSTILSSLSLDDRSFLNSESRPCGCKKGLNFNCKLRTVKCRAASIKRVSKVRINIKSYSVKRRLIGDLIGTLARFLLPCNLRFMV